MKEGMTYKRLGDLATFVNGYAFKPETWAESGIPIIRIQNLNNPNAEYNYYEGDLPQKFVVENGDLLISWSASLGAYIWKGEKAYLNQHIFKVVFDKTDIHKGYLRYAVEAQLAEMKRKAHGGTMQHIVKKDFDATRIPVPSRSFQEEVVKELDSITAIIADKREQLTELDNLAQAIFLDTFGDPLTNPKHWALSKIGDACEQLFAGGDVPKGDFSQEKNATYNIPIYSNGVKEEGLYGYTSKARVVKPAITISGRGTIGASFVRQEPFFPIIRLIVVVPDSSLFDLQYFHKSIKMINLEGNGNSIPQLTIPMIKDYVIMRPPLVLQQSYAEKVQAIDEQKNLIQQSIKEFDNLLAQRMEFHFA